MSSSSSSLPFDVVAPEAWSERLASQISEEKKFTREKDRINRLRAKLPAKELKEAKWELTDVATNKVVSLTDVFGPSHSKLLVYHLMAFDTSPCGGCVVVVEQLNVVVKYLQKFASVAVVCRAPKERLREAAVKDGWTLPIYSCGKDFTDAFATDLPEGVKKGGHTGPVPMMSSLYLDRPSGKIYQTYQTGYRGLEEMEGYFGWLDRIPANPENKQREHAYHPLKDD